MFKIAICDNEQIYINQIIEQLQTIQHLWNTDFKIKTFNSGESLCHNLKTNNYDLILLDILMDGIDGVETSHEIINMQINSLIIFVSSYDKRLKELFDIQVVGFLDKPLNPIEFEAMLKKAFIRITAQHQKIFTFNNVNLENFVYINDILYFESLGRKVTLTTKHQTFMINDTLKNIWEQIKQYDIFIRPSKSYITNLEHSTLQDSKNLLINNFNIKIGRTYKTETFERFKHFLMVRK